MRIIFIRHGTPDYTTDSLTPAGKREADALALRTARWTNIDQIFLSPLGRAQETAQPTLQILKREASTKDWLREFPPQIEDPSTGETHAAWDLMAEDFTADPGYLDPDRWFSYGIYKDRPDVEKEAEKVCNGLDQILESYGYRWHKTPDSKPARYFDFTDPTGHVNPAEAGDIMLHGTKNYEIRDRDDEKTILFFCHFGVTCVMLGHLLNISPVILWHATCIPPTGITVLNAEKRLHNTASFRMQCLGDVSHLHAMNLPVSGYAAFSPVFQG